MHWKQIDIYSELYTYNYLTQDDVCRLCWANGASKEIQLVKSEIINENIVWEVMKSNLEVEVVTSKPNKLCDCCYEEIHRFSDFKTFCKETDKILNYILQNCTRSINTTSLDENIVIKNEIECDNNHIIEENVYQDEEFLDIDFLDNDSHKSDDGTSENGEVRKKISKTEVVQKSFIDLQKKNINNHSFEDNSKLYKCFGCEKRYKKLKNRNNHEKHICKFLKEGFKCEICEKLFPKRHIYELHIRNHSLNLEVTKSNHNLIPGTEDCSTYSFSEEIEKKINKSLSFCSICRMYVKDAQDLLLHNSKYHGIEKKGALFKCFGCDQRFKTKKHCIFHEINSCEGLKNGYKCDICDRFLPTRRIYEPHMRDHRQDIVSELPEELFKCSNCKKSFKTKMLLTTHSKEHERRNYICDECGRGFTRHDYLYKHKLMHAGIKRYECPHCPFRATQKCSLNLHLRKHTGERPFGCDQCPQRCVSKSNLRAHQKRHLDIKSYECNYCNKSFRYKTSLEDHITSIHLASESFPCEHCGTVYTRHRSLKRHLAAKHKVESVK